MTGKLCECGETVNNKSKSRTMSRSSFSLIILTIFLSLAAVQSAQIRVVRAPAPAPVLVTNHWMQKKTGMVTVAYRGPPDFREGANCPKDNQGNLTNGQFNHPKYCDKFLNCWNGQLIVGQCPSGLVFNEKNGACDYPDNVDCGSRGDSRPPLPVNSECPKPDGTFPSPTNCSEFVVCQGGNATKYACADGLVYNQALGVCTYKDDTFCVEFEYPATGMPAETVGTTSKPMPMPVVPASTPAAPAPPPDSEFPIITPTHNPDQVQSNEPTMSPGQGQGQGQQPGPGAAPGQGQKPPPKPPQLPPFEKPESPDHVLWPIWPNFPEAGKGTRCPIFQGFLPVLGDCEAVVVCLGGFGTFFRCPKNQAFDISTARCSPIRMQSSCSYPVDNSDETKQKTQHRGQLQGQMSMPGQSQMSMVMPGQKFIHPNPLYTSSSSHLPQNHMQFPTTQQHMTQSSSEIRPAIFPGPNVFNGNIRYVYLPVNLAYMHQQQNNWNYR